MNDEANKKAPEPNLYDVEVEHWVEVTIPTGNFSNIKPGYKVKAKVRNGVHPDVAKKRLTALVERWVEENIKAKEEELKNG